MTAPTAAAIQRVLAQSPPRSVPVWRHLRRKWSQELNSRSPRDVINVALELFDDDFWCRVTAYELIVSHRGAIEALKASDITRLSRGLSDWPSVDTFACYIAGPAWREGRLATRQINAWLNSKDRWLRRTGVVCTVALNVAARGGRGDAKRTIAVCERVVDDRDDMVVKALSWALRSLVRWDRAAVVSFLKKHNGRLAPRVQREVTTKLSTGKKN